ncbi:Nop-domain-containing protein [Atractiella rhizophila]|nr:Nop-domain-containing protein [Atractiella rhizophila]
MLVLFESPLGYCLFRLLDSGALTSKELYKSFDDPSTASELVKLQAIHRFESTATAVEDLTSIGDGKLSKNLKKFLTSSISSSKKGKEKETLIVAEKELARAISKKLEIPVQAAESSNLDLFRGIRSQLDTLLRDADPSLGLANLEESDLATMRLGLGHSISRYKLKFSPDKVDTMVVQAVALLDELDKEINIYSMRVKEWYGWHFPELAKIITDNLAYAKVVKAMGLRTDASKTDFSSILPEDLEESIKASSQISMGTEISSSDLSHILSLCDQVISITSYRAELYSYLSSRMTTIAPNLTALLGELVGARLIAHSGSMSNLAKHPASTIQILGAEKALFRALKTKKDTPKYGLIFHSSIVGMSPPKLKGKMARMVATKAALSIRLDALRDEGEEGATIGIEERAKLERRLRNLEEGLGIRSLKRGKNGDAKMEKLDWSAKRKGYNTNADSLIPTATANEVAMEVDEVVKKKEKKEKRRKEDEMDVDIEPPAGEKEETKEERKARKKAKKEAKLAAAGVSANGEALEEAEGDQAGKKRKHEIVEKEDKQIEIDQPSKKKRKEGETEEEKKKRKEEKKKRKEEKKAKKATKEDESD